MASISHVPNLLRTFKFLAHHCLISDPAFHGVQTCRKNLMPPSRFEVSQFSTDVTRPAASSLSSVVSVADESLA